MERLDYIVGYKNLKIYQNSDYFSFSLDSILLANFVNIRLGTRKIIDLGCGNAIIPIILSKRCSALIEGVEIQRSVFDLAVKSVEYNNLTSRIKLINDDMINLKMRERCGVYNMVVSNPPYFPVNDKSIVNLKEEKMIARHEVKISFDKLVDIASFLLDNKGVFAMVHRCERLLEIFSKLKKNNLEPKRIQFVHCKDGEKAMFFLIEAVKNGKPGLIVEHPIILYDNDGKIKNEYSSLLEEVRK